MFEYYAIFGRPGCGKGTQSKLLEKEFNMIHISTGELLRREHESNGPLLVKDEIVIRLIKEELESLENGEDEWSGNNSGEVRENCSNTGVQRILLDGFPRNLSQLDVFDIKGGFLLDTNEDVSEKRVLKREDERSDDNLMI